MVGIGIAIGMVTIVIGFVLCTDHIENMYRNRHKKETTQMKPQLTPVFRTSHTQCRDCGCVDLLNLDEQCLTCFELAHA